MNITEYIAFGTILFAVLIPALFSAFRERGIDFLDMSKDLDNILSTLQNMKRDVDYIKEMQKDLHRWHNVMDADGVPVWHLKRSMFKAIADLADAVKETNKLIDAVLKTKFPHENV